MQAHKTMAMLTAAAIGTLGATTASAQVEILQDFETVVDTDFGTDNELFVLQPGWSGSSTNVVSPAVADQLALVSPGLGPMGGNQAIEVQVTPLTAGEPQLLRYLTNSGGNIDANYTTSGTAGFLLQVPDGAPEDLEVGLVIEDTGRADLEVLGPTAVIDNGTTVLYEFDISSGVTTVPFDTFYGATTDLGDGVITGSTYNIDSIAFRTASAAEFTFTLDNVAVNPTGDLSSLIPEPTSLALLGLGGLGMLRRRR